MSILTKRVNDSIESLINAQNYFQDVLTALPDHISQYKYVHTLGKPQPTYIDGITYTPSYIIHPDYLEHYNADLYNEEDEEWDQSLGNVPPWAIICHNTHHNQWAYLQTQLP